MGRGWDTSKGIGGDNEWGWRPTAEEAEEADAAPGAPGAPGAAGAVPEAPGAVEGDAVGACVFSSVR